MATKATDREYEDVTIKTVDASHDGYSLTRTDGWGFWIPNVPGVVPTPGSSARIYGRGVGYPFRGVDIDGREVFYRTPAEDDLHHRKQQAERDAERREQFLATGRAALDADYSALPPIFRRRIDHFREHGGKDWRWQYEAYEMVCCVDAVKIAAACPSGEAVRDFYALSWGEQKARVPELSDDHSGNTFGMACRLARHFVTEPENVYREHGAMTPLVGCNEYGCRHPR